MAEQIALDQLVAQARRGCEQSMGQLAQAVEPRLRAYIYRTTLDQQTTGDIVQETLLEMVKSLKDLQKVRSFWTWLFRIASNKTNEFFQRCRRTPAVQFSTLEDSLLERILGDDCEQAVGVLIRRELGHLVSKAAAKLKHHQRAVLSLRCFEGMSYAEIAQAVGCSETGARVSFFRAKKSLKKDLSRGGFSKSSLLLALIFFGKLTAPSEAAALSTTVGTEMLKGIGLWAALVGSVKANSGRLSAAAAGLLIIAVAGWHLWPSSTLSRVDVRSVRFFVQDAWTGEGSLSSSRSSSSSGRGPLGPEVMGPLQTRAFYETWLYYPEGPDGPLLRREQRWGDINRTDRECTWLQDGNTNYYYHCPKKTVYITNDPLWSLLLPTDPPDFARFLLAVCGRHSGLEYVYDQDGGLLTALIDNRVPAVKDFKTTYEYNTLEPSFFEYNWPEATNVIDNRDQMHRRGWTYFEIRGELGEQDISGRGRIPFVYAACKEHFPWLELRVGEQLSVIDTSDGAYLLGASGEVIVRYPAGSFFKGLARPWMGIRAYDIVRRDAVERRIHFEYECLEEGGWVTLHKDEGYSHLRVEYFIDMKKDVIDSISFLASGGPDVSEGVVEFSYLDDVSGAGEEFVQPAPMDDILPVSESLGVDWLVLLAQGRLGQLQSAQRLPVQLDIALANSN